MDADLLAAEGRLRADCRWNVRLHRAIIYKLQDAPSLWLVLSLMPARRISNMLIGVTTTLSLRAQAMTLEQCLAIGSLLQCADGR